MYTPTHRQPRPDALKSIYHLNHVTVDNGAAIVNATSAHQHTESCCTTSTTDTAYAGNLKVNGNRGMGEEVGG